MTIPTKRSKAPWALMAGALVLALAGGTAQLAHAMPGDGAGAHMGHAGGHGGMMMHGRLLQAVGATADQQTRIRDIMKAAHDDIRAQHQAAGDLRAQMMRVFTATTVDARAAEALRQKQLAVHDASSKRMLQAMIDSAAVLTPEQRLKMAELVGKRRDMMQRHRHERESVDGAPRH